MSETPGSKATPGAGPSAAAPASPDKSHDHDHNGGHGTGHGKAGFFGLALGSVGVVYGDIGTSPLYAFREALHHTAVDGMVTRSEVTGVVSLLLWSLTLIVTVKYVLFILFADNRGEGGTLSLLALAQSAIGRRSAIVFILGVLGASLFYGDAVITPAISVLSAVEGLKLVAPGLDDLIVPLTIVIIVTLFAVQSFGTGKVAALFGPITAFWFLCLAVSGAIHVGDDPAILHALNPYSAISFIVDHGLLALVVLGSVFLAVTGAEALYADMGHFGRKPIQAAWLLLVFPALTLNYLGQGALVLAHPEAIENPFFLLVPEWARLPYVILATVATIIASQAVITGAYSLTQQAVQLGLLPRLESRHTSETQAGQIYMPRVNWLLLGGVLILVVFFQSSSALASAYGISVTGEMVMTSLLAFIVVWKAWRRPLWMAVALVAPFLAIELIFLGANLLKVMDGGYFPLLLATFITISMWTWVRGTRIVYEKSHRESVPLAELVRMLEKSHPVRVPGTAVFLTSDPEIAPSALMHNLKHNTVLHAKNVVLTVRVSTAPRVSEAERVKIDPLNEDFTRVTLTFGYVETPNVPKALALCRKQGLKFDIMSTSFFLNRRSFRASPQSGMPIWQDRLFIALTRMAANATDFYRIPSNRVVELGQQFTV
ncbi:potassium transporter Kup [Mongoliimonas terrestris]|uniref:potassium transporter Kup n=1 Tax=Mongoliimonas terrestris TaxID=1709001 RepID=UPI00094959A0|nr:potassium transporter Kup [Mongoliimonas terrestris]